MEMSDFIEKLQGMRCSYIYNEADLPPVLRLLVTPYTALLEERMCHLPPLDEESGIGGEVLAADDGIGYDALYEADASDLRHTVVNAIGNAYLCPWANEATVWATVQHPASDYGITVEVLSITCDPDVLIVTPLSDSGEDEA